MKDFFRFRKFQTIDTKRYKLDSYWRTDNGKFVPWLNASKDAESGNLVRPSGEDNGLLPTVIETLQEKVNNQSAEIQYSANKSKKLERQVTQRFDSIKGTMRRAMAVLPREPELSALPRENEGSFFRSQPYANASQVLPAEGEASPSQSQVIGRSSFIAFKVEPSHLLLFAAKEKPTIFKRLVASNSALEILGRDDRKHGKDARQAVLDATDMDGNNVLHILAQQGDIAGIRQLVKYHKNDISSLVNAPNKLGQTPLDVAFNRHVITAGNRDAAVLSEIFLPQLIHALRKAGATSVADYSPGYQESLNRSEEINQDFAGKIKLGDNLAELSHTQNRRRWFRSTILAPLTHNLAFQSHERQNQVHIFARSGNFDRLQQCLQVPQNKGLVKQKDINNDTPLHLALRYAATHLDDPKAWGTVDLLIKNGAVLSSPNLNQETALTAFVKSLPDNVAEDKLVEALSKLKGYGFLKGEQAYNLLMPDSEGNTLLHHLATKGANAVEAVTRNPDPTLVPFFVSAITSENNEGKTPVHIALEQQQVDVAQLLLLRANSESEEILVVPLDTNYDSTVSFALGYTPFHPSERSTVVSRNAQQGECPPVTLDSASAYALNTALYDIKAGLTDAIFNNDIDTVKRYVECGRSLNRPDPAGSFPLHIAIVKARSTGNSDIVDYLRANGAKDTVQNAEGKTPMHLLVEYGTATQIKSWVNPVTETDSNGNNLLHAAVGRGSEFVKALVQKNAPMVNNPDWFEKCFRCRNRANKTPLELAQEKGDNDTAQYLSAMLNAVQAGKASKREEEARITFDLSNSEEVKKQLFLAIEEGRPKDVAKILATAEGQGVVNKKYKGQTPLDMAILYGGNDTEGYDEKTHAALISAVAKTSTSTTKKLRHQAPKIGSIVHKAVEEKKLDLALGLTELCSSDRPEKQRLNSLETDENGKYGLEVLLEAALYQKRGDLVESICSKMFKPALTDRRNQILLGETAKEVLENAVRFNDEVMITALADQKVTVRTPNDPVFVAAMHKAAEENNMALFKAIVKAGVNVNAEKDGRTLYEKAIQGSIHNFEVISFLEISGAKDKQGKTALHTAVGAGNYAKVNELLRSGADANTVDNLGISPLIVAVTAADHDKKAKILEQLIKNNRETDQPKTQVDHKDTQGNTALHHAILQNNINAIEQLEKAGARFDIPNNEGKTALDLAHEPRHQDVKKRVDELVLRREEVSLLKSLCDAVMHADVERVRSSIRAIQEKGFDINQPVDMGAEEPMPVICWLPEVKGIDFINAPHEKIDEFKRNKNEVGTLLLDNGVDINAVTGKNSYNALYFCANPRLLSGKKDNSQKDKGVMYDPIPFLLENGIKVSFEDGIFEGKPFKNQLLARLVRIATEEQLDQLTAGVQNLQAKVNVPNNTYDTPLHFAIDQGNIAGVKWLISNGANPHAPNNSDQTPYELAKEVQETVRNNPSQNSKFVLYGTIVSYIEKHSIPAPGKEAREALSQQLVDRILNQTSERIASQVVTNHIQYQIPQKNSIMPESAKLIALMGDQLKETFKGKDATRLLEKHSQTIENALTGATIAMAKEIHASPVTNLESYYQRKIREALAEVITKNGFNVKLPLVSEDKASPSQSAAAAPQAPANASAPVPPVEGRQPSVIPVVPQQVDARHIYNEAVIQALAFITGKPSAEALHELQQPLLTQNLSREEFLSGVQNGLLRLRETPEQIAQVRAKLSQFQETVIPREAISSYIEAAVREGPQYTYKRIGVCITALFGRDFNKELREFTATQAPGTPINHFDFAFFAINRYATQQVLQTAVAPAIPQPAPVEVVDTPRPTHQPGRRLPAIPVANATPPQQQPSVAPPSTVASSSVQARKQWLEQQNVLPGGREGNNPHGPFTRKLLEGQKPPQNKGNGKD